MHHTTDHKSLFLLTAVIGGYFIVMLDATIVNVSLVYIGSNMHVSAHTLRWIVNSYTLSLASTILIWGSLCDRLGTHRIYTAGLILFALSSTSCAYTDGIAGLLIARVVQGLGGGCLIPSSLHYIGKLSPDPAQRARRIGLWGAAGGLAAALGPLIGGTLTSLFGWRSVFCLNLPVIAIILFCIGICRGSAHKIDAGNVRKDFRVPLSFVRQRNFIRANLVGFCLNFSFFGELFVISLYMQDRMHLSGIHAGAALFSQTCSAMIAAPLGGRHAATSGNRRAMRVGLFIGGSGFLLLNAIDRNIPFPLIAVCSFSAGFGMAFAMPAATNRALNCAPSPAWGTASGIVNTVRQFGTVAGVSIIGSIFTKFGIHAALSTAAFLFFIPILTLVPDD